MAAFDVKLTAKQTRALKSAATEILYGGAAGGGKSYFLRVLAILLCGLIPGLNVYLFRRIYDDLIKNHVEGTQGFPVMLAPLIASGHVKIVAEEIRFWNGSRIFLCHCEHEKHRFKYQGAEIHVLLIDELTMFTEVIYRFLRGRLRAPGLAIPQWAIDFFQAHFGVSLPSKIPMVLNGSNPGNIGHVWVKSAFIDGAAEFEVRRMSPAEGGMLRQYIPARLEDNPHIDADDYENKLAGLGTKELVRAMRFGDWSIVAGAYFDNVREDRHKLPSFTPPKHWTRFRSFDWGSARPFSVGWWCIAEPEWVTFRDGKERMLPAGALIRYREWYGVKLDEDGRSKANEGLRLSAEAVGRGIKKREEDETIDEVLSKADPSLWKEDGGPSNAERMLRCDPKNPTANVGPRFQPADNTRVNGWQQMYARLEWDGIDDGEPMLYVTEDCRDWWRTVPALQHDETRPEDINTKMEDHCFSGETLVDTIGGPVRIADLVGRNLILRAPDGGALHARNCRLTRRGASVVRLTFDDGTQIICTPDHEFESPEGWIRAVDLRDAIRYDWTCSQSQSSAKRSKNSKASGTTGAAGTSSAGASDCIARCGGAPMATCQMAITSTTPMATQATTSRGTWSFCRSVPTLSTMARNPVSAACDLFLWLLMLPVRGMVPRTGRNGTRSTTTDTAGTCCTSVATANASTAAENTSGSLGSRSAPTDASPHGVAPLAWTTSPAHVPCVQSPWSSTATPRPRPVQFSAGLSWRTLRVLRCEPAGQADVYCLTVPVRRAFLVEGGISVANCADDTRYACMGRPVSRVPKPRQQSGPAPWTLEWIERQEGRA